MSVSPFDLSGCHDRECLEEKKRTLKTLKESKYTDQGQLAETLFEIEKRLAALDD